MTHISEFSNLGRVSMYNEQLILSIAEAIYKSDYLDESFVLDFDKAHESTREAYIINAKAALSYMEVVREDMLDDWYDLLDTNDALRAQISELKEEIRVLEREVEEKYAPPRVEVHLEQPELPLEWSVQTVEDLARALGLLRSKKQSLGRQ